uniref:Uncharacterized protein n=1 Tax=Glossina pallidipes TaxID=7398 RepID=A0A1B0AGC0_GLOPL
MKITTVTATTATIYRVHHMKCILYVASLSKLHVGGQSIFPLLYIPHSVHVGLVAFIFANIKKLPDCKNYFLQIDRKGGWLSHPISISAGFECDCQSMGTADHYS